MKTSMRALRRSFGLCAILLCATQLISQPVLAETFEILDEFLPPGFTAGTAYKTLRLRNHELITAGNITQDSFHGKSAIRKSGPDGKSWVTVETHGEEGRLTNIVSMFQDSTGRIYTSGFSAKKKSDKDEFEDVRGVLRKSDDNGTTWQDLYIHQLVPGKYTVFFEIIEDSAGALYLTGASQEHSGYDQWSVWKSLDRGASWKRIDLFEGGIGGDTANAASVVIDKLGRLFVGGWWAAPVNNLVMATVRVSSDRGKRWMISKVLHPNETEQSNYRRLVLGSDNSVFGVGMRVIDLNKNLMPCRIDRTSDGGQTWKTVADFNYPANDPATFCRMMAGAVRGDMTYFVGRSSDLNGKRWALIHKIKAGAEKTEEVLVDEGKAGLGAIFQDMSIDRDTGDLFTSGSEGREGKLSPWVVKTFR